MANRAKNRKTFKQHLPFSPMIGFQNNFTEMFLLYPLTKIAKMVPFDLTKWPPELKIEKGHRLSCSCQQFT